MAIQYHFTAAEILQTLGYTKESGQAELEAFEKEQNIKLPPSLFSFLSLRSDLALMRTSDLWQIPYFSYVDIEERIEEDREYWEENPDDCDEDEFYEFSQIPKEQWPDRVANYLQIGSDYGVGCVNFGICIHDLEQDNPPVYIRNEDNSLCDWELLYKTLSEFLLCILGDVLSCQDYQTAFNVLKEQGWDCQKLECNSPEMSKEALEAYGIDSSALERTKAFGRDLFYSYCYDNTCRTLYLLKTDSALCQVYAFTNRN